MLVEAKPNLTAEFLIIALWLLPALLGSPPTGVLPLSHPVSVPGQLECHIRLKTGCLKSQIAWIDKNIFMVYTVIANEMHLQ